MAFLKGLRRFFNQLWPSGKISELYYFDEVLPHEFAAINERRRRLAKNGRSARRDREVAPLRIGGARKTPPKPVAREREDLPDEVAAPLSRVRYPDPGKLFDDASRITRARTDEGDAGIDRSIYEGGDGGPGGPGGGDGDGGGDEPPPKEAGARSETPNRDRMRPRPVPCDATGLALSGGGVRSAAVSLGALQALHLRGRLASIDYLSTVSGGGYIGACLSAAMSEKGGRDFPFGTDVFDSPAIAHLRNYSNYLMPRNRSTGRNWAEAIAVVLRGLLANAVVLLAALLPCVIITALIYGGPARGSMTLGLLSPFFRPAGIELWDSLGSSPFRATFLLTVILAAVLLVWAVLRTVRQLDGFVADTRGGPLRIARYLLLLIVVAAFLDFQPAAIAAVSSFRISLDSPGSAGIRDAVTTAWSSMAALAAAVAACAGAIGRFLEASSRASGIGTLFKRALAKAALLVAALVLPLALWGVYLWLSGLALDPHAAALRGWSIPAIWPLAEASPLVRACFIAALAAIAITVLLTPNGYSLHRFYRDRLSAAFVFGSPSHDSPDRAEPAPLDDLKLSELDGGDGPYHIVNAAMNVQGSTEANRRGRNADFFMMSSQFVGSDLTLYASTRPAIADTLAMEDVDRRLNLATATAISGAAVSANMGSNTVRLLSPTLALLNIRLGYWLRNPRAAARATIARSRVARVTRKVREKLYLFAEMLNLLDERSAEVYLTDGGHIENLGLYELLKRGCEAIIVIDAEADPSLSFGSLLKVERYARIDLGIRITLPWEQISDVARTMAAEIAAGKRPCLFGPHCAIGTIIYEDDTEGTLVYFKASVTGDERDYVLDYKARNPDFPHETTGDQFFSEEQFEMYRALGFHMVYNFFEDRDDFALPRSHPASAFAPDDPKGRTLRTKERNRVRSLFPSLQ